MRPYPTRYLGDAATCACHDLHSETLACSLAAVVAAGEDRPFHAPRAAEAAGYHRCHRCMPHLEMRPATRSPMPRATVQQTP